MTLTGDDSGAPRVTFYVRGDMFGANDRQHEVVTRLSALAADGRIDDYDVSVWSDRVRLDVDRGPPVVDLYRSFERWADAEGVDIGPFFDVRERESFLDGTARELVLPVMCLAVRTEEGLETVAPNVRDGEATSVVDCLDRLEARDATARSVAVSADG
jgi:hypothetical protein